MENKSGNLLASLSGTMPGWSQMADRTPLMAFVDSCLRGVGQVVFMNNPVTGLLILVAIFLASPWLGTAGVIGLLVSTMTALILGLKRDALRVGLFGFNGILVGLALATFLSGPWSSIVVYIVLVSAFSTILMVALGKVFLSAWGVPPFTLPFNFATLIFLAGALQVGRVPLGGLINPRLPAVTDVVSTGLSAAPNAPAGVVEGILHAVFRGIGQLFFADNLWSGVLIVAAILVASRIAALFAIVGSLVGTLVGLALGADGLALYHGLWGFNSMDAALAVGGVFFVPTWRSALLAVGCAVATALLWGGLSALLLPWGLPALTLPFCLGTLAFVLMKGATPLVKAVDVADITTPEEHLRRTGEGVPAA